VYTITPKAINIQEQIFSRPNNSSQQWPKDLAVANKKIVVIGSGTAVTSSRTSRRL
jgi:cation diffusion facilitator CzcD-associated flavoprotein CzcO